MRHAPAACGWRVRRGRMLADGGLHSARTAVHQRRTEMRALEECAYRSHCTRRRTNHARSSTCTHGLSSMPRHIITRFATKPLTSITPSPLHLASPSSPAPRPPHLAPTHSHTSACAYACTSVVHMCLSVHACMHAHTRALPILPGVLPHTSTTR